MSISTVCVQNVKPKTPNQNYHSPNVWTEMHMQTAFLSLNLSLFGNAKLCSRRVKWAQEQ